MNHQNGNEFLTTLYNLEQIIKARGEWRMVGYMGPRYLIELWIDGKRAARYTGRYEDKQGIFTLWALDSDVAGSWGVIRSVSAFEVRRYDA